MIGAHKYKKYYNQNKEKFMTLISKVFFQNLDSIRFLFVLINVHRKSTLGQIYFK